MFEHVAPGAGRTDSVTLFDRAGHVDRRAQSRPQQRRENGGVASHMRRDIAAQPAALRRTAAVLRGIVVPPAALAAGRLVLVADASARHAAAAALPWIERLSGVPCDLQSAAAMPDHLPAAPEHGVAILVGRSAAAVDTLAALALLRRQSVPVVAVVDCADAAVLRDGELLWLTAAGDERASVATISVTTRMFALIRLGLAVGIARGAADAGAAGQAERALGEAPVACALAEAAESRFAAVACRIAREKQVLIVGRGWGAALAAMAAAMIGQLTDSWVTATVSAGGDDPIRSGMTVLVLASSDEQPARIAAEAAALRAGGGHVVALVEAQACETVATSAVALQLIACQIVQALGLDLDQPRAAVPSR
jgi:glucosamine--fructose-6-phosphate aminotransferase (isomerizing)